MIRTYLMSDMCEHPGSHKDLAYHADRMELSCRTCGRSESHPFKNLPVKQVYPDASMRQVGIDFTPYIQSKED